MGVAVSVSAVADYAEDIAVGCGIAYLIVRQFRWRDLVPSRMLTLPLILLVCGVIDVLWSAWSGSPITGRDAGVLAAELVLVAITGSVMGWATVYRINGDRLQYRLTRAGIALWAVFVGIRVCSFALAAHLHAHLLESSGAIVVSFGVNRLACSLVVRRRAAHDQLWSRRPEFPGRPDSQARAGAKS